MPLVAPLIVPLFFVGGQPAKSRKGAKPRSPTRARLLLRLAPSGITQRIIAARVKYRVVADKNGGMHLVVGERGGRSARYVSM